MANSKRRDPSPVRAGFFHGFLSLAVFGGLFGLVGAGVHLTGDAAAAGPSQVVALFERNGESSRSVRAQLVTPSNSGAEILTADSAVSDSTQSASLPNLGVSDPERGAAVQTASLPQTQVPTAPAVQRREGVTINGVFVPAGRSLSQVEDTGRAIPAAQLASAERSPAAIEAAATAAAVTISTPSQRNARPFSNPESKPVVALIIGGLGTSSRQTSAAIDDLPPEVTLSFIPDADRRLIRRAREKGHEVLLEVPMEAYERGRTLPHSQTLMASGSAEDNQSRLDILLSRGNDFYGVINHHGEKFADADGTLAPVFERLHARGLAFFRHGSTPSKSFDAAAVTEDIVYASASENIDTQVEAEAIERRLQQLESAALADGAALGTGFAYPLTMDIIVAWTQRLDAKGILLAPASAIPSAVSTRIETSQLDLATLSDTN
ncbi:MAG: divergent polysaccharide deacetylase family protein [Hyphomonadaceae bacterium]